MLIILGVVFGFVAVMSGVVCAAATFDRRPIPIWGSIALLLISLASGFACFTITTKQISNENRYSTMCKSEGYILSNYEAGKFVECKRDVQIIPFMKRNYQYVIFREEEVEERLGAL